MGEGNSIEKVQVVLQAMTKKFEQSFDRAKGKMKQFRDQGTVFANVMSQPIGQFQRFVKSGRQANQVGGRLATRFRKLTHGMKGFRMEMLGVMFFGMMMKNMFAQLFNPVMEAFGVMDLFREMLLILFIPIMETLFPIFLKLIEYVINLPEPVKKVIGIIALLGVGLGIVLFIIGSLALGIGSLILVFGGLFTIIDKLIPDIDILGVNVSSFVEAGIGIGLVSNGFESLKKTIKGAWEKFKELDFVKTLFDDIKDKLDLDDEFDKVKDWFETIKTKAKDMWEQFKNKLDESGINDLAEAIEEIGTSFGDVVPDINSVAKSLEVIAETLKTIKSAWGNIKGLWDKVQGAGQGVGDWFHQKIYGGLPSTASYMRDYNKREDDFIWRPGQGSVSINPNDTLVGFKGAAPNLGGGNGVNYNPTYNINVTDKYELQKIIDDNNRRTVDELRRLIKQ